MAFDLELLMRRSAFAVFVSVSAVAFVPSSAQAEECLLDTQNNGVADDTNDTDGGANDNDDPTNLACGNNANAGTDGDSFNTAVGTDSDATGGTLADGTPLGSNTAVGWDANATGGASVAIGEDSDASGLGSIAIGSDPELNDEGPLAAGDHSIAVGSEAVATADADGGIAIGGDLNDDSVGANVTHSNAIAIGADTQALNERATALGAQAIAGGSRSTAIGDRSIARGIGSVAIGSRAETGTAGNPAPFATAVGTNTDAQNTGSVAIGTDDTGQGAVATHDNQFVLGTRRHTYTAPGITSTTSKERQSGPLEVVTTDAGGNLASDGGQIFEQLSEQGAGIAIAVAMENPDLVGNETFGLAGNIGFFEGNTALAFSAMGVLGHNFMGGNERWALSGGVGVSLNEKDYGGRDSNRTVAGRAGLQVSW